MRHFRARFLISTLGIEGLVSWRAVENCLVASHGRGDGVQCVDQFLAKVFSLVVFCDADVFDMAEGRETLNTTIQLATMPS
jgi:hypothetical protein